MFSPTSHRRTRPRPLACGIAALLLATVGGAAQTYTAPGPGTFTNPYVWNFGGGPVPASDAALALRLQSFGGSLTASDDLNLTLQALDFSGNGTLTVAGLLGGNFAFTGGAGLVNFGSSATVTISAGVVMSTGLAALTLDGAGPGALTLSGPIASNTAAGAPLIVATDAANPAAGIVTLSGANTFSGGVALNSGTLNLAHSRALGDRANTLTVNGGHVRTNATLSIANAFTLNSTLNVNGSATLASPAPLSLSGALSGAGGVTQSGAGLGAVLRLRGINTYTGATSIRGLDHAGAPLDEAASIHIAGAAGSILTTSAIDVRAGGIFRLDYADGHSAANARVSAATGIVTAGAFLETMGNDGLVQQSLGTVNAGGLTTILASANGGGPDLPGAATQVSIADFQRAPGGAVTFSGPNLGGVAVAAGLGASQGNILLGQINGAAPGAALVGGGGGAGATNISILPWALGDTLNEANRYDAGSGFVTYGAHGVRLLDAFTEYNTSNSFNGLGDAFQNIRIANSVTAPAAPVAVNSIFIEAAGLSIGGANAITLGSGALATLADHTISAPLLFGAGGAGEAVVSVVGPLNTSTTLTLSGQIAAGSLVKSGHGILALADSTNAIAGPVAIHGGQLSVDAIAALGGATSLTIASPSQSLAGAALTYTGGGADTLAVPVATVGGMAGFRIVNSSLDVTGAISGSGGVRKDGPGTLLLSGANTYSGGTYLGEGAIVFDSDARLGAAGGFLHTSGGTLNLTGPWSTSRPLTFETGNTLVLSKSTNNVTLSGAIDGTGPVQSTGSGAITITSADNGYAGAITLGSASLQGGTLAFTGSGALNAARVRFGASGGPAGTYLLDLSAATAPSGTPWRSFNSLTTTSGFTQTHSIQLGITAVAPVDLRVSSGTFGQGSVTGTGVITGFGKLMKVGPGAFTLGNANTVTNSTFTGGIEVWDGTLHFSADSQLGNPANGITLRGGTLNSTVDNTTARAITLGATPQPVRYDSSPLTLANGLNANGVTSPVFTLNGAIGGPGGFNKAGNGTVRLGTANNYDGDTQITAGILSFTDNSQLGSSSSRIRLGNGTATLSLSATPPSATTYPLPRTIFILGGTTTIKAESANATLSLSGQLMAASGAELLFLGPGKFTVSGDNHSFFAPLRVSFGGTANSLTLSGQLRRGTIRLDDVNTSLNMIGLIREVGAIQHVNDGSTIQLGGGGQLTAGFNNTAMTWAGDILGSGVASFTKTGTGNITMTADANTFPGGLHLLSGSGSTMTLSSIGALPLQTTFTLGAWGSTANRGPVLTLAGSIAAPGGRIADAQVIHSNSGEIQGSTTPGTIETIGSLRGAGMSTVTMLGGGTLSFAGVTDGLTRQDTGTFLFRASNANMGTAPAAVSIANLLFGNSGTFGLLGGGGGPGTTSISILPYAVGDTSTAGLGSNFVTYGANGIRVLNTTTEVVNHVNAVALTGGATDNVRFANSALTATTLGGGVDRTIHALNIAGTASRTRIDSAGAERLIVASGLVLSSATNVSTLNAAGTAGVPLGIQVAELQTGAGNTRELNVFTTGGDLAIGAAVTTSGGLTKSGAGTLFLTSTANTYTGATTVNAGTLAIDSLAALGGSAQLQLGGGHLRYRGGDATLTQSILAAGGAGAGLGASAGLHIVGGVTLTAPSGAVSGNGGILKDGTGVLRLTGANTNSGVTIIAAGALAIDSPAALGSNPRVVFTDSSLSAAGGQTLRFDAPMTLTQDFVVNSAQNGVGFGFDTNGNAVTLTGTLLDARNTSVRGLYKFGAGELNLTATGMYTGATQIFGGTLRLSGADGSIMNSTGLGGFRGEGTVLVHPGASLVLDNATAPNANRLPDVWDTPFGTGNGANGGIVLNGGELKLIGGATNIVERTNQISIASSTVTLDAAAGGLALVSGQLIRGSTSGSSALLIRGTNLGATPGPGNANWFVTDLGAGGVQLHGAGGAEGTPFVNILRGAMGDTSATGVGVDLVTYAADVGFRTLTSGEYTSAIPAGNFDLNRAPNLALTGPATVNGTTAVSAIKLSGGGAIALGSGGTLLVSQSTVLATGAGSIGAPSLSTNLAGAGPSLIFLTPGAATTLTVHSVLPGPAMGKYGEGTVVLNGRRIGAGPIALKQGTLALGAGGSLNPLSQIVIDPGATFDLAGGDRIVGSLAQDGGIVGARNLGQTNGGNVALGANRLTLYDATSTTFTGGVAGAGGLVKALASTGATAFAAPLLYTGPTVVRGGALQLAGRGSLATSSIELRGGSLVLIDNADQAGAGGHGGARIGAATPIFLSGGGIAFSDDAAVPATHQLGAITLGGEGRISIVSSASAPRTVAIADLLRAPGGGVLSFVASNLGLAPSPSGGTRIFANQINGAPAAAALIGGGSGVGATTQSILPWAWDASANSLLTYGAHGFRPLAPTEYESALNSPSTATANLRTSGTQTLTAPRTVNSLVLASGSVVAGPHDLTLTSGALVTFSATIGASGNALLTGAANSRELAIRNNGGATLHYDVTTSGGVMKSGPGTLTLTGTNTFTGGLSIHEGEVLFDSDARLGASGGAIRFGGETSSGLSLTYAGGGTLPFARPIATTSFGTLTGAASERWQFQQPISGAGGIGYAGNDAIFELAAANPYTGPTNWTGGHLYLPGDSAFGMGGEVLLNGGASQHIVLRGDWTSSRLIHAASPSALNTDGHSATWSGHFIGTAGVTKNGNGSLILTEAMPYVGSLTVNAGALRLRDRGSLAAGSIGHTIAAGAALLLDDTAAHFSDRLHDSSGTISLAGGALTVLGSGVATTEEVLHNLSLAAGASTVTLSAGAGQSTIVRLSGALANTNAAASLWRGTNLGVNAPGSPNSANLLLTPGNTNGFPLIGGSAPAGHPSIGVIRGGFGDTSATGLGTQLVTYDEVKGVRLLDPATEYTATLVNGSSVTDNVKADGAALALADATLINALWLKDGGSVTGAGELGLRSGNLLVTGAGNTVAKSLVTGFNALAIGGPGDVNFTSAITSANSGGLIKTGAGTLTLSVANAYSGGTVLKDGVLALGDSVALASTLLQVQGGEMRNVSGGPLTIANDVQMNGAWKIGGTQDFTFSGSVVLNHATREIETAGTGVTTLAGVLGNSQSLINYGLTKTGPGTLVLANAANTYDGPTTLRAGVLSVGALANGSVGPLVNPSGIGQSWGDADQLVFDGGTLRYTGPLTSTDRLFTLTPNGGTIDAQGAGDLTFSNTGAIAAPGSGPRTLALTGNAATVNTMAVSLTDGPSLADATSLTVSTTHWRLTNANPFTGATTVQSGTLEAAAAGALGGAASVTVNTGGTLLLSGAGDRIHNAAAINLNGGELDTGGTSEGAATTVGLGALTLSASSTIDFTGGAATLTFASAAYASGVLSIANWSGVANTAGIDGVNDRLIFAGDNTARLAFLGAFGQSSIAFAGFGAGYAALQFDANHFEVVPVPEPSGLAVAASLLGLIGWRERRRAQRQRRAARV